MMRMLAKSMRSQADSPHIRSQGTIYLLALATQTPDFGGEAKPGARFPLRMIPHRPRAGG
jgi:hypothetical protein